LSGGIGVDLDLVNFGVRYNYGLTKVFKEGSLRIQMLKIAYSYICWSETQLKYNQAVIEVLTISI
jgi:hypothetical protein